jgi:poly(3-hydroxybutyrate) depolymerase
MKFSFTIRLSLVYLFFSAMSSLSAQDKVDHTPKEPHIADSQHYSHVFGDTRKFRIFLPPAYYKKPHKDYPVIYFFHGWAERYFGSMGEGYANYEQGDDNEGDHIANFVASHDVIVVKMDGLDQFAEEEVNLTPYNIGTVETFRQFPIYFPEFVDFIDNNYRTIADREHRAVSGLSMGGFMAFWVSGKYPHLVCGVGNFCGSPEFFVGPLSFPVEYNHLYMYDNYAGLNVRLNYGTRDKLSYYHTDLNRVWPAHMDNYEYKIYEASHITCGLGEMF